MSNKTSVAEDEKCKSSAGNHTTTDQGDEAKPDCFVIMPIANPDGYHTGHFQRVYEDIFIPACERAGFQAVRADSVRETNMIHLDILQKIIESPMAICDLSNKNPNVLFELGLRQAFDKPVALVQEVGSSPIFDIAPLRYTEYRKERVYHEVLEGQKKIASAIRSTFDACQKGEGINSITRLLALTKPASLAEVAETDNDPVLKVILSEMNALRSDINLVTQRAASTRVHSTAKLKLQEEVLTERQRQHRIFLEAKELMAIIGFEEYILKTLGRDDVFVAAGSTSSPREFLNELLRDNPFLEEGEEKAIREIPASSIATIYRNQSERGN